MKIVLQKKTLEENWLIFVEDWNLNQKICTFLQFLVDFFSLDSLGFSLVTTTLAAQTLGLPNVYLNFKFAGGSPIAT